MVLTRTVLCGEGTEVASINLLAAGVFGDSLGSLRHGVLGKLAGQEEPDGSLDLPGGESRPAVVVCKSAGLGSDALKDVIDEGVHDAHGLGGDASVGMHLLQHFVDVDAVALPPPLPALLVSTSLGFGLRGRLLGTFARCCLGWHYESR